MLKKERGMNKGLFKFFSCEEYRDDFLKGHLYFNSLNFFKKHEESEVPGQNDYYECCSIHQPDSVKITLGNLHLTDFAGPISISCNHDLLTSNIICFSTIRDDLYYNCKSFEEAKQNILFPKELLNYGRYAVAIPQGHLFIERFKTAALKGGFFFCHAPVNYYDFSKDNISCKYPEIAFQKRSEFSYQREYRFLLQKTNEEDKPVILEVGDLSDITMVVKSADINKMLDISYSCEAE